MVARLASSLCPHLGVFEKSVLCSSDLQRYLSVAGADAGTHRACNDSYGDGPHGLDLPLFLI